ncbi:hypothetical protein QTP88_003252 [Uroleucon formosanum]
MTAPSDVRFKQRAVIEFLVAENVKPVDIHRRLLAVYGNQTLDVSSVRSLALRVKGSEVGKAIIADQDRSGRPVTVTDEAHKQKVDDLVKGNRRIKQSEIAIALGISKERVQHILCELEYRKICARDKSWVHHYDPENKRQSMEFRHKTSPVPKKFKVQASAGKVMLTVFWDSKGVIHTEYLEKKSTINSINPTFASSRQLFCFLSLKNISRVKNSILTRKLKLKLNDGSMLKPKNFI